MKSTFNGVRHLGVFLVSTAGATHAEAALLIAAALMTLELEVVDISIEGGGVMPMFMLLLLL